MTYKLFPSLFLIIFLIIWGCGEKKPDVPPEELSNKNNLENLAEKMKEVTEGFSEGKKVNPVDFRELKSLLPEKLGAFSRKNLEGEKTSAMGINVSTASADYSDQEGTQYIDLKITDLGSVSGFSGFAAYGWYLVDIDKENEQGYERTFTYKGNKGFEKYNNQDKNGEVSILVAKRFIVEVNGNNVTMDQIKAAVDMVDIGKLESWKDFGVE